MKKLKHIGSYLKFIAVTIWKTLRSKRTWIVLSILIWTYFIAWFNSNYEIKTKFTFGIYQRIPAKEYKVATVSAQMISPTPKPLTEKEIVMREPHGEILWKIYFLESTLGEKDGCRINNEGYGGFGVKDGNKVVCYETFEKAVDRAEYWFSKALTGNTVDEALCVWNTGKVQPMCDYSLTFNSL